MENTLGKRIAKNRKQLGLTQDQLAEKLGITAQAVSKWENDLSCPDISILPKLADIFQITVDELLGRSAQAAMQEVSAITEDTAQNSGFTFDSDSGKMDFHWEGIKLEGLGLACWFLVVGIIYLTSQIFSVDISFWNILWTSFLLTFGIFGLFTKFSIFRLGCALTGGYFLLDKLHIFSITFNSGIIIGIIILLFGSAMLVDELRKGKRMSAALQYADKYRRVSHAKIINAYHVDGNHFSYDGGFGSNTQVVALEKMSSGEITTCFGEFTIDFTQVGTLDDHCKLTAECSFGELTLFIPRHYVVIPDSSTSFAGFNVVGQPDQITKGTIYLYADVSFGQINVHYI